jgi:DNA-binding NtrC family response regulator
VDDDAEFRLKVHDTLGRAYSVTSVASEAEFHREFRPYTFDLILLDMRLNSGREGLQLLRKILSYDELQPVIMVSAYGDTDAMLDSAELGALMFLHKQEFTAELLARMAEAVLQQARIRRHLVAVQDRMPSKDSLALTGKNPAVRRAADLVERAADDAESTVLVVGESGTGHEFAAQVIHDRSRTRSDAPFVMATGMATWSKDSRAALFGSPSCGDTPRRKGLLEQANRGLLFLDSLEALDPGVRSSLDDVLRRQFLSLDPSEPTIPLDLQLVAGTGVRGSKIVAAELQRAKSGGRLVEVYLPPLRERREDIPLLATYLLQELRQAGRTSARTLSREALSMLEVHTWPGNLAEFRNAVEFGAIKALGDGSEEIAPKHLPSNLLMGSRATHGNSRWDYRYHTARAEVALTERAIEERGALSKTQLAALLGYTDRFAFSRRIRTALAEYPDIAREFPKISGMFRIAA